MNDVLPGPILGDPTIQIASPPNTALRELRYRPREPFYAGELVSPLLADTEELSDLCRPDELHVGNVHQSLDTVKSVWHTLDRVKMKYERITYKTEAGSQTIILRNPSEVTLLGCDAIAGIEVNREGETIAPRGADQRQHIISLEVITKRTPLNMNRTYGELEAAS